MADKKSSKRRGRPSINEVPMSHQLAVRFTEGEIRILETILFEENERGRSLGIPPFTMSALLRFWIKARMAEHPERIPCPI